MGAIGYGQISPARHTQKKNGNKEMYQMSI